VPFAGHEMSSCRIERAQAQAPLECALILLASALLAAVLWLICSTTEARRIAEVCCRSVWKCVVYCNKRAFDNILQVLGTRITIHTVIYSQNNTPSFCCGATTRLRVVHSRQEQTIDSGRTVEWGLRLGAFNPA